MVLLHEQIQKAILAGKRKAAGLLMKDTIAGKELLMGDQKVNGELIERAAGGWEEWQSTGRNTLPV